MHFQLINILQSDLVLLDSRDLLMKKIIVLLICTAITLTYSTFGLSEERDSSELAQLNLKTQDFNFSLSQLSGDAKPIMLRNTSANLNFSLPVPALWSLEEVTLNLKGTSSRALNDRSQLAVLVNGQVVRQYPLKVVDQTFDYLVTIPVNLLKPGFNEFQLMVSQHYIDSCEYTEDSSLWTQLDLVNSAFKIRATPKNQSVKLNQLDSLFDKSSWEKRPVVQVLTTGMVTEEKLGVMGLIAQGIGSRYDFIPVSIQQSKFPKLMSQFEPASDSHVSVLLGTHAALGDYLRGDPIALSGKPMIAVKKNPFNERHFFIILAGENNAEMHELATAFALKGVPWPEVSSLVLSDVHLPDVESLNKRFSVPLASKGAFPIRALDFRTTTYTDRNSSGSSIKIWNTSWQGRMQVRLHLSYAGGMSSQSALNIITNGVLHGTIPLDNKQGGGYDDYAVTIPSGSLKPGWNTVQFQPVLIPQSNGGDCQPFFNGNLGLTIYEGSTFQKFGGDELINPDLALISGAGNLYTEGPLGKSISFHFADTSSETISAGLTLVSKLEQMFKKPLLNATFTTKDNKDTVQQFWIGPYANLPQNIRNIFTGKLPQEIQIEVPLIQSATLEVKGSISEGWDFLESLGISLTPPPKFTGVNIKLTGGFENTTFAATQRINDQSIMLFTANNSKDLQKGVATLTDYSHWAQLRGTFAYWNPTETQVHTSSYEDAPFSAYGLRGGFGIWISQNPWGALFVILGFIIFMSFVIRKALKTYKKRKHAWTEEG